MVYNPAYTGIHVDVYLVMGNNLSCYYIIVYIIKYYYYIILSIIQYYYIRLLYKIIININYYKILLYNYYLLYNRLLL